MNLVDTTHWSSNFCNPLIIKNLVHTREMDVLKLQARFLLKRNRKRAKYVQEKGNTV